MRIASAGRIAALVLALGTAAQADTVAVDAKGMTLYSFDSDSDGKPTCYDGCAANWPPYLGQTGETRGEGWTLVERTDGSMQWAYDGKPAYYFAGDRQAGDKNGDGRGGVWHVLTE